MKKGLVDKLSIVMAIIMSVLVFYTAGMPQSFTCVNHLYEAENPEAFGGVRKYNLVVDGDNVSFEDNEEFLAKEKELELERQKVKDKIDPIFNKKISRIPLWFLYTFEYEEFYRSCVQPINAIWVGSGITDQFTIKSSTYNKQTRSQIASDFGYLVDKGEDFLTTDD